MADPASERAQRKVEAALDAASIAFEVSVLEIIAERLGTLEGASVAEIYAAMPKDTARIRKAVEEGSAALESLTGKVMGDMAETNDQWAEKYYKARGVEQRSAFNNTLIKQTLENNTNSIKRKVSAICRSSVAGVGDRTFEPVADAYRRIVSGVATAMTNGVTLEKAVSEAVGRMAQYGLRVRYDSGVTRNLQTAVRTNVMDAYRSTMTNIREIQGAEFGADGVEVTAHALCAPDHQDYQGRQYSNAEWKDIQYQPKRPLVTGANCGHTVFPVILGVSSKAYSDKELRELKNASNAEVEFEGLSGETLRMTRYDASQYQRKLETAIRKQKETAYLQKISKADHSAADRAARYYTAQYKRISKQAGLTPRMDNIRIFTAK